MTTRVYQAFPFQIWAPLFSISPFDEAFSRDLERAKEEYRGYKFIWLTPDAEKVTEWAEREGDFLFGHCQIPSELLNLIVVYQVDEERRIYPPLQRQSKSEKWQTRLPEGLYRRWINTTPKFALGKKAISMRWPKFKDGKLYYVKIKIQLEPGPVMPVFEVDEKKRTVGFQWPPNDLKTVASISPETESRKVYGRPKWESAIIDGQEIAYVISPKDPKMRAVNFWTVWPEPFDVLLPPGSLDILSHYAEMKSLIEMLNAGENPQKVLRIAEGWVNRLTGDTTATVEAGWFMPKLFDNSEHAIARVWSKFGIDTKTFEVEESLIELNKSETFREIRLSTIPVKRAYGWLGYFWWEFYRDLKGKVTIKLCQNCGNIIRGGRSDRKYCSFKENPDCYRTRNMIRQRKRRKGLSKRQPKK